MTQINGEVLPNFLKTHAGFDAKILIPDSATGWKPLVVKQFKNMDMLKIAIHYLLDKIKTPLRWLFPPGLS